MRQVATELRAMGIEPNGPTIEPPSPIEPLAPLPPFVRKPRRWPWYVLQIAVFFGVLEWSRTALHSEDLGYAPVVVAGFAAFAATGTIVGTRDAIARLATRPAVLFAWLAVVVAVLASCAYLLLAVGLASFTEAVSVLAVVAVLTAYATIFFAWITGPLLFGLPLFRRAHSR